MSIYAPASVPCRALATLFLCLLTFGPAAGQQFDSDNVVVYAQLDQFTGYNDVWGFVGSNGREYVIQGLTTGTAWWDVDDPTNVTLVATIPGPASTWRDMFVIGDHAYVGTEGGGGIQIVDISDPTNPTLVNTYSATVGASHNIFGDVARSLLYVVGGFSNGANGGVQILDASDPVNLVQRDQWTNRYVHDMAIDGTTALVCLIDINRFRLLDTSDVDNILGLGTSWADPTGAVHATWPLGDGVHAAIAEETGGGHVKIVDYSTPTAISQVAAINPVPAASAHNVHVEGDNLFVSWYAYGTRVYDVSTPSLPSEIAWLDTYPPSNAGGVGPGNWGVYPHLPSGLIASNDGSSGLFLFEIEPDAGFLDGTVTPASGSFLAGATATYVDIGREQTVDAGDDSYKFSAFPGGSLKLRFEAFGYEADSATVALATNGTTTTNAVLTQLPSGSIDGTVTDVVTGNPVGGVEVDLVGTPLSTVTDAAGLYSFPVIPADPYTLHFFRHGYRPPTDENVSVTAGQSTTQNKQIEPASVNFDFSDNTAWTIVNEGFADDPANETGHWEFGEPNGTVSGGLPFQTDLDHSFDPEDQCAVTGNALGAGLGGDDVDSLVTRLLSPVVDLSNMTEPHVFYYRWYAVNSGGRDFDVEVTDNGGAAWTLLETTAAHEAFWQPIDVDLTGQLSSYSAVQFRFTAQDPTNSQLVEAALDDFAIYDATGAVSAPILGNGLRLELSQNFPNPFPSETSIRFAVPQKAHVELSVFDVRGARVAVLADGSFEPGPHEVSWDGHTITGRVAASGVYFYKLSTEGEIRTRKMIRLN